LNAGSITSGFGAIDTGSSNITTTGVGAFGSLDISGNIDIDGTTNLDVVDIDGAVNMATTALVTGVLTTTAATVFNGGFASNNDSTITNSDNGDHLTLIGTNADGATGPHLSFLRQSSSPANNDLTGHISFNGLNDASQAVNYAHIQSQIIDIADGAEDGRLHLEIMNNGTLRSALMLGNAEVVINDDSHDADFRVESNALTHAFFVDGGNSHLGLGTAAPGHQFHFLADTAGEVSAKFESNQSGAMTVAIDVGADRDGVLAFQEAGTVRWDILMNGSSGANALKIRDDDGTARITLEQSGLIKFGGNLVGDTDTDTTNTGNVTLDFTNYQNFVLTLTGNTTLVNPTTEVAGSSGFIAIIQDSTGGRTITLGDQYETANASGLVLTSAAGATDLVPYVVVAAGRILLGTPQRNFS